MYNIFLMICLFFLSAMVDASQNLTFTSDNNQLLEDIKQNAQQYKHQILDVYDTYRCKTKEKQEEFDSIDVSSYKNENELENIKVITDELSGVVPCWDCLITKPELLRVVAATNPNLQIDGTGDTLLTWLCSRDQIRYQRPKNENTDFVYFLDGKSRLDLIHILLNNKTTDVDQYNSNCETAFFKACKNRAHDTIMLLLNQKKRDLDINKPAKGNVTPFQYIVNTCNATDRALIIQLLSDKRLTVDYDWIFTVGNENIKNFLLNSIIGPEMFMDPYIAFIVKMKTWDNKEKIKADAQKEKKELERKFNVEQEKFKKDLEAADRRRREDIAKETERIQKKCNEMMQQDAEHALNMQEAVRKISIEKGELILVNKTLRDQHTKEVQSLQNQLIELQGTLRLMNESEEKIKNREREKEALVKQHRSVKKIMGCLLCGSIVVNFILFYLFRR